MQNAGHAGQDIGLKDAKVRELSQADVVMPLAVSGMSHSSTSWRLVLTSARSFCVGHFMIVVVIVSSTPFWYCYSRVVSFFRHGVNVYILKPPVDDRFQFDFCVDALSSRLTILANLWVVTASRGLACMFTSQRRVLLFDLEEDEEVRGEDLD